MATLVTSFLLLLVILGNNQASPVPLGDHGDHLVEAEGPPDSNDLTDWFDYEEAEPLTLKTQNDGNDDYDDMGFEQHVDPNNCPSHYPSCKRGKWGK